MEKAELLFLSYKIVENDCLHHPHWRGDLFPYINLHY